ncbi:MAG: sorbosone dehydrogenase family protein [Ferruginibacter sp.]
MKNINFLLFIFSLSIISCSSNSTIKGEETVIKNTDTSSNIDKSNNLDKKHNLDKIKLPEGFSIKVYAEVPGARSMTMSPDGVLFVGTRGDKVFAVKDENNDGRADKIYTIASGLNSPNGVAFADGYLYVATISTILRFDNIESNLSKPPAPVTVYDKFPTDKHHGWKFIAFGPDGKLYVPVGAPCNICESENPVYASITRMNKDGSAFEIFAKGIRNTVGFAWHPETKNLWFTDNGRDLLGENIPEDELNTAPRAGMHFGYPYCHQGNILDPEFGKNKKCDDYVAPVELMGPHVAALGMRFYTGNQFPQEYKNQIFISLHGSWNRTEPIGYKVMSVRVDSSGKATKSAFAEGWLQPDGKVLGRPVDVEIMKDGSLLVSDDYSDAIYRITYK